MVSGARLTPLFLLPLIIFLMGPYSVIDATLWINWGRQILEGGFYAADSYSVLPTSPQVFPSWVPALLYALLDELGGLSLVMHFHHVMILPLFFLIYRQGPLLQGSIGAGRYWLYLCWLGMIPAISERPAFLALFFPVLMYKWLKERPDWKCVGLTLAWANFHGSFILGPIMIGWNLLIRGLNRKASFSEWRFLLFSMLVTLINPFGWRIYEYLYQTTVYSKARNIQEWQGWDFMAHFPIPLLWLLLVFGVLVFLFQKRKQENWWAILRDPFLPILALGPLGIRHTVLAFVLLLPFLARIRLLRNKGNGRSSPVAMAVNGLLVAIAILLLPPFKDRIANFLPDERRAVYEEAALFKTTRILAEASWDCPILNNWRYGNFLSYQLGERYKIFVDGRNTTFSQKVYAEYIEAISGMGILTYVKKHGACLALLHRQVDAKAIQILKLSGAQTLFEESSSVLLKL